MTSSLEGSTVWRNDVTVVSKETSSPPIFGWRWLSWQRLVTVSGIVATLTTAGVAAYLSDIEGGIVALGFGVSTCLFWRGLRRLGITGLIVVSAITFVFMAAASITNSRGWAGAEGLLIAVGLATVAGLLLVACIGWLLRSDASSNGPSIAVAVSVVAFAATLVVGALNDAPEPGIADYDLVAENVAFSETELSASPGTITVAVENRDLFWHTFTVEELGVDLRVPVSAEMTVTFDAPPGEYRFVCAIPGHADAGMEGTLTVVG